MRGTGLETTISATALYPGSQELKSLGTFSGSMSLWYEIIPELAPTVDEPAVAHLSLPSHPHPSV